MAPITPGWIDRAEIQRCWGSLSPKEKQAATLMAYGHSVDEVGEIMVITERTLRTHLSSIFQKMYIGNRYQLIAALWLTGIVSGGALATPKISRQDQSFFDAWL